MQRTFLPPAALIWHDGTNPVRRCCLAGRASREFCSVLLSVSPKIAECYAHAASAREHAERASHKLDKASWLFIEERWLFLASSFEFEERSSRFIRELPPGR
jgi:hypothetical protein